MCCSRVPPNVLEGRHVPVCGLEHGRSASSYGMFSNWLQKQALKVTQQ